MSTHTPGPWAADPVTLMVTSERGLVCVVEDRVHADYDNSAEIEANARLIASAPCLLRELQRADDVIAVLWAHMSEGVASRVMTDLLSRGLSETRDTRRAAIRKATGEPA